MLVADAGSSNHRLLVARTSCGQILHTRLLSDSIVMLKMTCDAFARNLATGGLSGDSIMVRRLSQPWRQTTPKTDSAG